MAKAKKKNSIRRAKRHSIQSRVTDSPTTKKEHAAYMSRLAGHYQEVCDEIDSHIVDASELVSQLDPLKLLQRAYGEYAALTIDKRAEAELGEMDVVARTMIDYVQCLIVSTSVHLADYVELTDELWDELKSHIRAIFYQMVGYFIVSSAKRATEVDFDEMWEDFFTKAQMNWCFVRGDRHLNYFHAHHTLLLQPHDEVFKELFGT